MILRACVFHVQVTGRSQSAAVDGSGGHTAGIHQCHRRHLAFTGLGTLPVWEVPGGVPDRELVVGRAVSRTKAGPAEALPDDRTRRQQIGHDAVAHQFQIRGHGTRVNIQREGAISDIFSSQDAGCGANTVISPAAAAGDLPLLYPDPAVAEFAVQIHPGTLDLLIGLFLHLVQNVRRILLELVDGIYIAGMHGHCNGALYRRHVHIHASVIVGKLSRL